MFVQQAQHLERPDDKILEFLNINVARGDESAVFQYGDDFVLVVVRNTTFEYFGAELFHVEDSNACSQMFCQNPEFDCAHNGWNECTLMQLAHHCAQWL